MIQTYFLAEVQPSVVENTDVSNDLIGCFVVRVAISVQIDFLGSQHRLKVRLFILVQIVIKLSSDIQILIEFEFWSEPNIKTILSGIVSGFLNNGRRISDTEFIRIVIILGFCSR